MNFKDLNLKKDYLTNTSILKINEQQIEVKQYLPIADKNDLIEIALQKAEENGTYNEILLDVYFHLNLIYLYTNIEFSDKDREDEMQLYDILESNHIIDNVISCLMEGEYDNLKSLLITMLDRKLKYENSAAAVFRRFVTDLPAAAATASEIVENFDREKYSSVVDFATAANGGRSIITNLPTEPTQEGSIKPPAAPQDHLKKAPQRKVISVQSASKKD